MRARAPRGGLILPWLAPILALLLAACAPPAQPSPTAAPAKPAAEKPVEKPADKPAAKAEQKPTEKPAAPPVEIRIGHGFAAEENLWLMGAKPEITPNQGKAYTLQFTAFRGNADRVNAYEAGQIDGGTITGPTALFAAEQGLPFKLVASVVREANDPNWFNTTFMALQESGITSAKDLEGKTVAIVDFKSATELWARAAIEQAGLDPSKDVKFVVVPFPAMGEALRSKKIDVGVFPQPFYAIEHNRGGVVDVFSAKTGVPFDEELLEIFLRPEFVSRNQAAVKAFAADLSAATNWYLANTKDARQALIDKQFVRTPPDIYLEMKDYFREPSVKIAVDGLTKLQDLHLKLGWQTKKVDLNQIIDPMALP